MDSRFLRLTDPDLAQLRPNADTLELELYGHLKRLVRCQPVPRRHGRVESFPEAASPAEPTGKPSQEGRDDGASLLLNRAAVAVDRLFAVGVRRAWLDDEE